MVNTLFERNLSQFVPKPGMAELFKAVICDSYMENGGKSLSNRNQKIAQIAEQNNRKTRALELLISKSISSEEYRKIRKESENTIAICEAELKELNQRINQDLDIAGLADLAVANLINLTECYATADSEVKRAIVSSIYPEKWVFDGEIHRTPEINEAAQLIYHINRKLRHKKTGIKFLEKFYSGNVIPLGFEPRTTTLKV
jgi:site-specific DNA recombinase